MKIAQYLFITFIICFSSLGKCYSYVDDSINIIKLIKERLKIQARSESARDVRNLLYQIKADPLLLNTQPAKKPDNNPSSKDWKSEYQLAKENLKKIISGKKEEFSKELFNPVLVDSTKLEQKYNEFVTLLKKIPVEEKSKKFYFKSGFVVNPGNYFLSLLLFSLVFLLGTVFVLINTYWLMAYRRLKAKGKGIFIFFFILTQIFACAPLHEDKLFNVDEELNQLMDQTKTEIKKYKESEKKYLMEIDELLASEKEKESLNHYIAEIIPPIKENELLVIEEENITSQMADIIKKLESLFQGEKTIASWNSKANYISIGIVILTSFISLWLFGRGKNIKLEQLKVCPRCFSKNTLVDSPTDDRYLKCTSKYCDQSTFHFEKTYAKADKLSLPMIGTNVSGKTHWLANLYAQGKDLLASDGVKTPTWQRKYRIAALENSDFTKTFEILKEKKKPLQGTVPQHRASGQAPPVLFSIGDGFRSYNESQNLSQSTNGLALCFDFSGEMMAKEAFRESQEMVANANGFLLFIDPFQISKLLPDLTYFFDSNLNNYLKVTETIIDFDNQIRIINNATSQYLKAKNLPESSWVNQPVAICITKIDLFPHHGPLKGKYGENLLREITKIDHRNDGVSLKVIQRRSEILKKYLPIMLAKPNILEIFEKKFGDNYMLFPIANKGIDLSCKVDPFGTMEPLLWQLHMQGFDVLDK